jgi:ubiquinone/menaquinone biosynthesis C-methylase UbiE
MKDKLKSFLKRSPEIYNFAKKGYFSFHSTLYRMHLAGTKSEEKYWATRHHYEGNDWGNQKNEWVTGYRDSQNHSHRNFLIERICKFSPSSILEVGCNCGPNLYLLAKKFPSAKIRGIDINPVAVQKGNEWFVQEGISNVKLLEGKADELGQFQDRSFDVAFTDAVLIYIGPDKIKKVMEEMLRVTRQALILLEWHCFNSKSNPLGVYVGHWMRDYVALFKEFVPLSQIQVIKLPEELWSDENWQRYGGVVKVVM